MKTGLYARNTVRIQQYNGHMTEKCPRKNLSGAVNEQGSLTDLAWLAGHIDGDGWIGIFRRMRSPEKRYYRYSASLAVMTTSDRNAENVMRILRDLDVNFNHRVTPPYVGTDGSPRRAKWRVEVVGNEGAKTVLTLILPYLAEKRRCAELVLEYIEWRETQPRRGPQVLGMSEKAEGVLELLRQDRSRHDPSTTTRLAPALAG